VGPWWGCLAGRSFLDGRRKIIRSQQQRSSNEKEIRTAARMRNKFASIYDLRVKRPVYSARALNYAVSEYNRKNKDGATDLPWAWLSQIILAVADRFCKQEDKKKRVNEVDTWQVGLNSSAQATSSGLFC
jgi:uncharacterized protein (DUF2225 family)